MARKKQKGGDQTASPSITFGSMPFDVLQTVLSFTDPGAAGLLADGRLMSLATDVKAHATKAFARERVHLTEARAREIVLAFFKGERYQDAKELVLAAAAYVKAEQLSRAIARDSGATWADAYTAFELALWIYASGIYTQLEVIRGTNAATAARRSGALERVARLVAALRAEALKPTPGAVLRWRGETNTPANYERARRDLRQAQRALSAARKPR